MSEPSKNIFSKTGSKRGQKQMLWAAFVQKQKKKTPTLKFPKKHPKNIVPTWAGRPEIASDTNDPHKQPTRTTFVMADLPRPNHCGQVSERVVTRTANQSHVHFR